MGMLEFSKLKSAAGLYDVNFLFDCLCRKEYLKIIGFNLSLINSTTQPKIFLGAI